MAQGAVGLGMEGGPLLLAKLGDGPGPAVDSFRTDHEADARARLLPSLRGAEPVQQIVPLNKRSRHERSAHLPSSVATRRHLATDQRFLVG